MVQAPKRPLVGAALACIIGTFMGLEPSSASIASPTLILYIACCSTIAGLAFHARQSTHPSPFVWAGVLMLWLGMGGMAYANACHQNQLYTRENTPPQEVDAMEVLITSEPRHYTRSTGHVIQKFRARVLAPSQQGSSSLEPGTQLRITWFGEETRRSPHYGDQWAVSGKLRYSIQFRQPPFLELTVDRHKSRRLGSDQGNPWMASAIRARQVCQKLLNAGIESHAEQTAVLNSLMLGYMDDVSPETRSWFVKTGTIHIFAISGSHVVIVAGVIIFLLRSFRVSRDRWFIIVVPLLIFYTYVTGLQISAIRAVTMAALYWLAPCLGRRADIFSALSLAAIAILLSAPHQIQSPGFILSFLVTLALASAYPSVMRLVEPRLAPDPLMMETEPTHRKILRIGTRYVAGLLVSSLVAELAAAPIVAYYFNLFVPIGILSNLIMVPLAFLAIVTGMLSLSTGLLVPWLGETFNYANVAFATLMLDSMEFFASLPAGHMDVEKPSFVFIMLYYGLMALVMTFLYRRSKSGMNPADAMKTVA